MDTEAQEKIALKDIIREYLENNGIEFWETGYHKGIDRPTALALVSLDTECELLAQVIEMAGYPKPLDRPELREKVKNLLGKMDKDSVSKHGLHGYMITNYAKQILALIPDEPKPKDRLDYYRMGIEPVEPKPDIPKDKPPLLREENCHQVDNPSDYNMGAEAQREVDIKHYEGGE